MRNAKFLGTLYLIAGFTVILFSIGWLLVRLIIALFGLVLINKGLQLRNMQSVQNIFTSFVIRRGFGRR